MDWFKWLGFYRMAQLKQSTLRLIKIVKCDGNVSLYKVYVNLLKESFPLLK